MATTKRTERRKAEREKERRRAEEIERTLEQPSLPRFEAPPTGRVIESPGRPHKPRTP